MTTKNRWIAVALIAGLTSACGASRVAGWEREQERAEGNLAEVLADAEAAWLGRENPDTLQEAITLYEQAIAINPNQPTVLTRLARAYYFLGDGYRRGDEAEQIRLFDQAIVWGERAMATDANFVKEVQDNGAKVEDAVQALDPSLAGAVYWSASALGKWARLKGFTTLLSKKTQVKKWMEWVTTADSDYYFCGPDRYWGAYYSIAPSFAGGDLDKSKEHYEKSIDCAPNFVGTKVLMADTYATKVQDRELFTNLLEQVIAADPTSIPEVVPEQKVEQQKAKELLAEADDLFASLRLGIAVAGR